MFHSSDWFNKSTKRERKMCSLQNIGSNTFVQPWNSPPRGFLLPVLELFLEQSSLSPDFFWERKRVNCSHFCGARQKRVKVDCFLSRPGRETEQPFQNSSRTKFGQVIILGQWAFPSPFFSTKWWNAAGNIWHSRKRSLKIRNRSGALRERSEIRTF